MEWMNERSSYNNPASYNVPMIEEQSSKLTVREGEAIVSDACSAVVDMLGAA